MKIETLHVHQRVRHPQYGLGVVKAVTEHTAEIQFDEGRRTVAPENSGLEAADPQTSIQGLSMPLEPFLRNVVEQTLRSLGLGDPNQHTPLLGKRWHGGKVTLHPADPTLQTKEVPLEAFFHKVVLVRNQLRVLEQKLNAHPGLSDGEKVELQDYITRCYGSLTTFNLLFQEKEEAF